MPKFFPLINYCCGCPLRCCLRLTFSVRPIFRAFNNPRSMKHPFLRQDRKSYQVPDALSVSALPQKTRISWLSEALWGNDYFVFDVRRRAVPNLQSSACMVPDSVLTLAIPTSRAMRLFGSFHCSSTSICAQFSRVRWRYFRFVLYSF